MENVEPDISNTIEVLGETLSENLKLEELILQDNKIKWVQYCTFWEKLKGNTSLKKINVSKTDLSDRILEKMTPYLTT